MNPQELQAVVGIVNVLLPLGIQAGTAIARAIKAIWGPELTEEEMAAKIQWLTDDATARAALAHLDAGHGGG